MPYPGLESSLFKYAMWYRVLYGVARIITSFFLLRLVDITFSDLIYHLLENEFAGGRLDYFLIKIDTLLQLHPLTVTYFLAFYLIFWGVVDIVLSISLLRHSIWAFPVTLYLIGFFVAYSIYRYTYTHSPILLAIIIWDTAIFWLVRKEYLKLKISMIKNAP